MSELCFMLTILIDVFVAPVMVMVMVMMVRRGVFVMVA